MRGQAFRHSLALVAALMVLMTAALAGGSLWILHRFHGQEAHAVAARQVLDQGERIVTHLTERVHGGVSGSSGGADWSALSELVRALHTVENGLQYVSVTKNGITVFHEQTRGLDTGDAPASSSAPTVGAVNKSRGLLALGGDMVPVVVFSQGLIGADGAPIVVEAAVRKEAVTRAEQATTHAIRGMFRLSLVTVLLSFGMCALLVLWTMRREGQRERRRREEEHLAFAGVMANGIVHDFRNPMSAMRLDVQMLRRETDKGTEARLPRLGELSGRIQQTLDRMDKVFQEFLFMSKPPADQREPIDLAACLRESLAILGPRFEQAGVEARLELPTQPLTILGYPSALQRGLVNVLINAEQATPAGGLVRVRVTTDARTIRVDIIDNGPGVPPDMHERIFDMFVTTRPGGTGLGLFLARTAITRCGGTIRVLEQTPAGGACFRIVLPQAV